jgi:glycosyltransferase involved in cell wall biosynthesis
MHLYGGAQQVLYLLAGLKARGVENILICARGSALATALHPGLCEWLEVPMRGDADVGFVWRCQALLAQMKPDLLHVHSRRGADIYGGLAARRAGVPAVLSRRVDNPEPGVLARAKYRRYQAVIAISARIRDMLINDVGLASGQVALVPDAVDSARFRPGDNGAQVRAELGLPADAVTVALVAQLIPRKGHRVLLDTLPTLLDKQPRLHVLFFGQGPLQTRLESRIQGLGLSERVHLLGFRDDMDALLPAMDLLVHPALREGMGVALLESMACGVPVLASRVGGIPDVVEEGVSGRLVPPGDRQALTRVLAELLNDPDQRRRLGAAGRQRVLGGFSIDQMVEGNLAVYRKVLGPR